MTFQELLDDERAEGHAEGRAKEKANLVNKLAKTLSLQEIADMLEEDVKTISEIVENTKN